MKITPEAIGMAFKIGVFIMIVAAILISTTGCSIPPAYFSIDHSLQTASVTTGEIVRFSDGSTVPEGYQYLGVGEFKSTSMTMKCDYAYMLAQAELITKRCGGHAYRLFNIVPPDNFTTMCYSCDILILKKV